MKASKKHKSLWRRRNQKEDLIYPFREELWGFYVADGMNGTFEDYVRNYNKQTK